MKQYLLLLRSADFTKQGSVWASDAINVYVNSNYKNYSYTRSNSGLNLIGDYTYTGIEVTSPSSSGINATPLTNNSSYVTDVGEVVRESASPSVYRFIDTSSRVDVLAYRHAFTNLSGTEIPSLKVTIYESDDGAGEIKDINGVETGLWLKSAVSQNTSTLLIKDVKPYIKIELEINSELTDLSTVGLIFYMEIGIHEIVSPVLSRSAKNILKRFPSWTKIYEDSVNSSTPSSQTPDSVGGKFINSIVQEHLENAAIEMDYYNYNKYIQSADINMLDWVYVAYSIPANVLNVVGDGVELAKADSLNKLFSSRKTDFIYYNNIIDKQIIVNKYYTQLLVNGNLCTFDPVLISNDFDNFGAMVGLPRLYLETNERYKARILDVYINQPGVSMQGIKNALRRELDIWKAFGATPDSYDNNYYPTILEMQDIEYASPYFNESGIPQEKFKALVADLNARYPSNYGYVKWGEGVWDYAGLMQEGVGRVPVTYDGSTPLTALYKPGVGDFNDSKFIVKPDVSATVSFTGSVDVEGVKVIDTKEYYPQINLEYEYSLAYDRVIPDYDHSRVNVNLTYEVYYDKYGIAATPTTFYVNLNKDNEELPQRIRNLMYVGNTKEQNDAASPEYNIINIFNNEGRTYPDIIFRNKINDADVFLDHHSTPRLPTMPLYFKRYQQTNYSSPDKITVKLSTAGWDEDTDSYLPNPSSPPSSTDYWFRFVRPNDTTAPNFDSSSPTYSSPTHLKTVEVASPYVSVDKVNFLIHSDLYPGKLVTDSSTPSKKSFVLNGINDLTEDSITDFDIQIADLYNSITLPQDATPKRMYINATKFDNMIGGYSYYAVEDTIYPIPSSPAILYTSYNPSNSQVLVDQYFEAATVTYTNIAPFRTASIPSIGKLNVYHNENNTVYYPFTSNIYESYRYSSTPFISGYIDDKGNVYESSEIADNVFYNNDKYLSEYNITKGTLGILPEDTSEYYINNIIFKSNNDNINLISNIDMTNESVVDSFNTDIFKQNSSGVDVSITVDDNVENLYSVKSGLEPGWIYLNDTNYYIYSKPIVEIYSAIYRDLNIAGIPRDGAPIIVKVDGVEKRQVSFSDSSTPSKLSLINKETVYGNYGNNLYASYKNIYDASVTDEFTGLVLKSDLSSLSNELSVFNSATPSVVGRAYTLEYKVADSFILDKDYYDQNSGQYVAKLTFDSTPASTVNYEITYESNRYAHATPIELDMTSDVNPLNEGFVYIDKNTYNFDTAELFLSPRKVRDTDLDLMYLSIISYDTNGNLKPNQTFNITGPYIAATPQYVTTNENGYANAIIRYSGEIPTTTPNSYVNILGVTSSNANAHANSVATPFSENMFFEIERRLSNTISVSATAQSPILNADGISTQVVSGYVYNSGQPVGSGVVVMYRKARTLKTLFATSRESYVLTDANGKFTINNIIVEQSTNPGHWLFSVETNGSTSVPSLANRQDSSYVTVAGDIVYWYEKISDSAYINDRTPVPYWYRHLTEQNSSNQSTPMFLLSHSNEDVQFVTNSAPNWLGQKWLALTKYDQYQLGILGSTPNTITVYENIHPDYEED